MSDAEISPRTTSVPASLFDPSPATGWTNCDRSYGPILVGTFLNLTLYGIFVAQVREHMDSICGVLKLQLDIFLLWYEDIFPVHSPQYSLIK